MREQWKDIFGYEHMYQVSNFGQVKSLAHVVSHGRYGKQRLNERILNSKLDQGGRFIVSLHKCGTCKMKQVSRLVAEAFIGDIPYGKVVCHGPLGPSVNTPDNLYFGTMSENQLDRRRDGTSGKPVRQNDGVEFERINQAARETGCRAAEITSVCKGRRKTCGGFKWEYI